MFNRHPLHCFASAQNRAGHIDFKRPLDCLGGHIFHSCAAARDTSVVDQSFDRSQFFLNALKHTYDLILMRNISVDRECASATGNDFSRERVAFGLAGAEVDDDGVSAMARQLAMAAPIPRLAPVTIRVPGFEGLCREWSPWKQSWQLAFQSATVLLVVVHVVASC